MIKLISICIILSIALISTQQKYTKYQALQCFVQKASKECEQAFNTCKQNQKCQSQLKQFNRCTFYDNNQEKQQIFNGYCFRRWYQRAIQTKQVIKCMNSTCNLLFNSDIGTIQLYQCMQNLFLEKDDQLVCQEECQEQMGQKLRDRYYQMPTKELYNQEFRNKDAQNVANLIIQQCINQKGKGKKLIEDEEEENKGESNVQSKEEPKEEVREQHQQKRQNVQL